MATRIDDNLVLKPLANALHLKDHTSSCKIGVLTLMHRESDDNEIIQTHLDRDEQRASDSKITASGQPWQQQRHALDVCLPHLIAQQSHSTPDAIALVDGATCITYGELNRRANQLAHYLQTLGVGPNTLVPLYLDRSFTMLIGLLAILKAGGAYVPLDPSSPLERISFMLQDIQAAQQISLGVPNALHSIHPVLVTQQQLAHRLAPQRMQVVCLDTNLEWTRESETEPLCLATQDKLAYIIYTSGSTGKPKGVQITHGSLLNLIQWHQQAFQLTANDRATQLSSLAFDAAGWEIWPYLTLGASLFLVDEPIRLVPETLRDWLLQHAITITFLPTALAEKAINLPWPPTAPLRLLLTGADTLHHFPPASLPFTLINNYGPTEATVVATSGPVLPTATAATAPSIGRPIDNVEIYILDTHGQPVPPGQQGELYIGGPGVALGYLNLPELTAQKFIANPFSQNPNARLYKTGDLARLLPDGQIAFIGRADYQMKIRGYRIEPNEIIATLHEHPAIVASTVLAREQQPGDKRLVAYIVTLPGTHISLHSLRETLAKRLPDYMIPATFVQLPELPLTLNGKVDREALPEPDNSNTLRERNFIAPVSPVEKRLAPIIAALLNLDQIGIDENFFMLGGHSLLGTQVIMRVASEFGVELSLRALFDAPTVHQLATVIEQLILSHLDQMSDEELRFLL